MVFGTPLTIQLGDDIDWSTVNGNGGLSVQLDTIRISGLDIVGPNLPLPRYYKQQAQLLSDRLIVPGNTPDSF